MTSKNHAWMIALLIANPACIEAPVDHGAKTSEASVASIRVQALALEPDSGLEGMKYDVLPVACDDGSVVGAPRSETRPLEVQDAHRVSELFQVLPAGCYDIVVTPLAAGGVPSETCGSAHKERVEVFEGKTTDVTLLSQCQGHDPGALDIIASLNHEPEIVDLSTEDGADFGCGTPTRFCATAKDIDSDPLDFDLHAPDSCQAVADASEGAERCWTLTCGAGAAAFTLRVYDMAWRDAELIRIEDWFADEGRDDESHAEAAFTLHFTGPVRWPDMDADGYGDAQAASVTLCDGDDPQGLSDNDDDCDDSDPRVRPGAPEICGDGVDNDCDQAQDCAACPKAFACKAAGPTAEAARCMNCSDPKTGGVCFRVAEGGTLCNDNFWCGGKPTCSASSDCALTEVCVMDTCCAVGHGICAAAKLECSLDGLGVSPEAMSTLGTATGKR